MQRWELGLWTALLIVLQGMFALGSLAFVAGLNWSMLVAMSALAGMATLVAILPGVLLPRVLISWKWLALPATLVMLGVVCAAFWQVVLTGA
ncbi:MAG: hypothetical protein AB8B85_07130 [Paracoccaceae bacterium]